MYAHVTGDALSVNSNGAVHDSSDMSLDINSPRIRFVPTNTDAGREEMPGIGVSLDIFYLRKRVKGARYCNITYLEANQVRTKHAIQNLFAA